MNPKVKFWLKVGLAGGVGAIVMLAIIHRVRFLRHALGV